MKRPSGNQEPSTPERDDFNRRMMTHAIKLARRAEGRVEPNPMVGCVIVKNGRIIGQGHHRRFGEDHAEAEALRSCTQNPKDATVYVTLEPCSHHGKTPPCTEALIEAKVGQVLFAIGDPNKAIIGGGKHLLRKAGIDAREGLCRSEAAELAAPFVTTVTKGRPYIIAKWAQSLDGKLTTRTGHSKWISCEASRRRVHLLRARVDAILVGSGTAYADDPLLTARDVTIKRTALRIVLDSGLRIKPESQLATTAWQVPTLVFTTAQRASSPKAGRLAERGVEIASCRRRGNLLSLSAILKELHKRGITNLMVEGGPATLSSFLQGNLVDEALVFVSPKFIGGAKAPGPLDGIGAGAATVDKAITPLTISTRRSGIDTLYHMRFTDPLG